MELEVSTRMNNLSIRFGVSMGILRYIQARIERKIEYSKLSLLGLITHTIKWHIWLRSKFVLMS
jgi:hypothetical protein